MPDYNNQPQTQYDPATNSNGYEQQPYEYATPLPPVVKSNPWPVIVISALATLLVVFGGLFAFAYFQNQDSNKGGTVVVNTSSTNNTSSFSNSNSSKSGSSVSSLSTSSSSLSSVTSSVVSTASVPTSSSGSVASVVPIVTLNTFTDSDLPGFSFKYDSGWTAPQLASNNQDQYSHLKVYRMLKNGSILEFKFYIKVLEYYGNNFCTGPDGVLDIGGGLYRVKNFSTNTRYFNYSGYSKYKEPNDVNINNTEACTVNYSLVTTEVLSPKTKNPNSNYGFISISLKTEDASRAIADDIVKSITY